MSRVLPPSAVAHARNRSRRSDSLLRRQSQLKWHGARPLQYCFHGVILSNTPLYSLSFSPQSCFKEIHIIGQLYLDHMIAFSSVNDNSNKDEATVPPHRSIPGLTKIQSSILDASCYSRIQGRLLQTFFITTKFDFVHYFHDLLSPFYHVFLSTRY